MRGNKTGKQSCIHTQKEPAYVSQMHKPFSQSDKTELAVRLPQVSSLHDWEVKAGWENCAERLCEWGVAVWCWLQCHPWLELVVLFRDKYSISNEHHHTLLRGCDACKDVGLYCGSVSKRWADFQFSVKHALCLTCPQGPRSSARTKDIILAALPPRAIPFTWKISTSCTSKNLKLPDRAGRTWQEPQVSKVQK